MRVTIYIAFVLLAISFTVSARTLEGMALKGAKTLAKVQSSSSSEESWGDYEYNYAAINWGEFNDVESTISTNS